MVALNLFNRLFVLPTTAAQLASHYLHALAGRGGQRLGQLKVTLDAFGIGAIEAEDGLGVAEGHIVGHLSILGNATWCEVADADRQGL